MVGSVYPDITVVRGDIRSQGVMRYSQRGTGASRPPFLTL
jgi:hypothetical protein